MKISIRKILEIKTMIHLSIFDNIKNHSNKVGEWTSQKFIKKKMRWRYKKPPKLQKQIRPHQKTKFTLTKKQKTKNKTKQNKTKNKTKQNKNNIPSPKNKQKTKQNISQNIKSKKQTKKKKKIK